MNYKKFFVEDNKSGWKCVESKLFNRHPEVHSKVVSHSKTNTLTSLPFKEQIYCFINGLTTRPECPECNKDVKYKNITLGFQEFCGVKCSNRNVSKLNKIKETNIKKYGYETAMQNPEIAKKIKEKNFKRYGVDNVFKSEEIKSKRNKTILGRYGVTSPIHNPEIRKKIQNKTSKIEESVTNKLNATPKFRYKDKEYDLIVGDDIVEVDGDYFHPDKLIKLSFTQISSAINDKSKIDSINTSQYNLHKVKTSVLHKMDEITLDNIKSNSYIPDYNIGFTDIIIPKEYFIKYKHDKGEDKLAKNVALLLKFVRTFQPELPILPNDDDIKDILSSVNTYDTEKIWIKDNGFNNNCSVKGVNYLKHNFNSYWHSAYKGKKSPIDAWVDDKIMAKVIAYRIGLNKSGEVFDFTLKELVRGLSAYRHTISFFKPILASAIYEHYLGDISNPTVFDPCCGFGGRLLGFKGKYPGGTYIGCEPDVE